VDAARQAVVWTLFHYGPVGWAMYALMGAAFAYFAYRRNLPLNIRSLLSPLFGRRVDGWTGHSVDILSILGTVFGIATTLGIGVVQLSYGMHVLFGTTDGVGMQIALIVLAVVMATISTVSGVDKGIRRLSEANVLLAVALLVWIVITGDTRRLFDGIVMNVGDFVARFPSMVLDTYAWDRPDAWMQGWTLFFWAWWVAWAPFVGLFLARISRGRSLKQFILGVLVIPFAFIAVFISILGNSALELVIGGDRAFAETAVSAPERAFFDLMQQYPLAPAVVAVALLTGLLFYVTSADSGALILANLSSKIDDPRQDAAKGLRVFWSLATGLLTLAMLLVGGVPTLQQATVIIGLPVSVLIYLVMISMYRALRTESQHQEGYTATMPIRIGHAESGWRKRLRRSTSYPSRTEVARYVEAIVKPALAEVMTELREAGVTCRYEVNDSPVPGVSSLLLTAHFEGQQAFTYQIYPVAHDLPTHARNGESVARHYYRLEVFTASGSHGYDICGYSVKHLIGDVLGHFESHVEYLRISAAANGSGADQHDPIVTDWQDDFDQPEEFEDEVGLADPSQPKGAN
jgi:choline/glycine/proline betaine transport protein